MRSIAATLALCVVVTACAEPTVRNLRANVPVITTNSTKTPRAVSDCITAEWFNASQPVNNIPREGGITLTLGTIATFAVVDIDERPDGSFVKAHILKSVWSKRNRKLVEGIRADP
jgi:hypothetical protein